MNLRSNKKAFTIVELVIVIAVIAILAAVLIPTFAGLIEAANTSADIQTVKQLNTILASENPSSTQALKEVLENNGIEIDNCKPIAKGTYYYYVASKNIIVYCDSDNRILYPENTGLSYDAVLWVPFPLAAGESVATVKAGQDTVLTTTANNAETTRLSVVVPAGATSAETLKLVVKDTSGGINLLGSPGNYYLGDYSFDISLQNEKGEAVTSSGDKNFTVNIQLPTGLDGDKLEVYHEETAMDSGSYEYDKDSGNLEITTNSFSPYRVSWASEKARTNWVASSTPPSKIIPTKGKEVEAPEYAVKLDFPTELLLDSMYVDLAFVSENTTEVNFNVYKRINYEEDDGTEKCAVCYEDNGYYAFALWFQKNMKFGGRSTVYDFKQATLVELYYKNMNESTCPSGVLEVRLFKAQDAKEYIVVDRIKLSPTGN